MFVVSLGSRTTHSGIKTSISTELKFVKIESKIFPCGSQGVIVHGAMPYSTPGFLNQFILYHMGETVPYIEQWLKYMLPSGKRYPYSPGCCHWIDTITVSSEAHSILLAGQLLQDTRKVVRPVGSTIVGTLLHFSDWEVSSWPETILWRMPW